MCISVFAIVKRGGRVLVGVPEWSERWTREWISSLLSYSQDERLEAERQTRLPSTYIYEGEHPEDALKRIMNDQLGVKKFSLSTPKIFSYNSPSDWYPGNDHWDLVFVYRVATSQAPRKRPLWKELVFLDRRALGKRDFGWNNDFVRDLGLVS
jgi:hypothetical protein